MFCRQCGAQNDQSSLFCSKCGAAMSVPAAQLASNPLVSAAALPAYPRISPTPPAPAPTPPVVAPISPTAPKTEAQPLVGGAPLGAMGDRAIAAVLDTIAIATIFAPVGMWATVRWGGITPDGFELHGIAALFTISTVSIVWFLYHWVFEGLFGATLGKLVMNVRVRRVDGSAIGLGKSLIRNLLRMVDGVALYLVGFLVALLSRKRQRLGDHAADTVVVQGSAGKAVRVAATLAWVAVIAACFMAAYKLHVGAPLNVTAGPGGVQAIPRAGTLGTQASPAPAGPRVTRAEMGTDSTDNYQIIGPSTEFYTDTLKIVCVWNIAGTDFTTPLKSVWIAEDVGDAAPPNYQLAAKSMSGVNEGKFYLTSPANGWPIGKYRLEIYIGDTLAKQIPFSIKQR
ncbi:MAG TPA: RDD family protein [Candidatus Dormibacteraeota bacterium]|nr:RDD family protein [Candidatus Dormibacteraeota bacterium]